MLEYVIIVLNMLEYARILNMSDAVHSIRSLCKLLSSYPEREACSGHCHTFKMERFAKE